MTNTFARQFIAFFVAVLILIPGLPPLAFAADIPDETASIDECLPEETLAASEPPETLPDEPEIPEFSEPTPSESEETEPSEPASSEPAGTTPSEETPVATDPSEPTESPAAETDDCPQPPLLMAAAPPETVPSSGPGLYFGLLHAHSSLSTGEESPDRLFQYAAATENLDFFALTDRSDSFDNHESGAINTDGSTVSADWAAGKAAAAAVTGPSFLGIFGYEMSWPARMKIGHISTFGTPGFQSWAQDPYRNYDGALEAYYDALSAVPGAVSQFNHPGTQYGSFRDLEYSAAANRYIRLIELDFSAEDPCRYYTEALDNGWHLAPTGSLGLSDPVRTAVHAASLTENGILEALHHCRCYATEDADLEIRYSLDGYPMGSRVALRHLEDDPEISVSLRDPTDSALGLVEVISPEGSLAQQVLDGPEETLTFPLCEADGYYFLKITQPDGDLAVSAPIWVDSEENLGISALTCQTEIPVQNEELALALELYNRESSPLLVESLEVLVNGIPVFTDPSLTRIPALTSMSHPIRLTLNCVGTTELSVKISGTLDGHPRVYEAGISLGFHQSEQVTAILVDNGHENAGTDRLNRLNGLALKENIVLHLGSVTAESLKTCRFLLVTAPARPFSREFLDAAAEFARYGGNLVICGQADRMDADVHSAGELNRLLAAIGSGMRFEDDTVLDPVNNGGSPGALNIEEFGPEGQVFRFEDGCSLIPGSGTALVTGWETTLSSDGDGDGLGGTAAGATVLMAEETLAGGGNVVAAGSLFLDDTGLREPESLRDPGYANRRFAAQLLGIGEAPVSLKTIQAARTAEENTLVRLRGYVTAGTSNPYNTFPDTIYLQDETGGIAVTPFREQGIQAGTALQITGLVRTEAGNRILDLTDWEILDLPMMFPLPETGDWKTLLEPAEESGRLVEITGTCLEVYSREDHTLAGFLLEDNAGNRASVQIEDFIFAGSDGKNELHRTIRKGRTVSAIGLLHVNEYGQTVIRVRNCEEVVWIPPGVYLNPKTGDAAPRILFCMMLSGLGLLFLKKRN